MGKELVQWLLKRPRFSPSATAGIPNNSPSKRLHFSVCLSARSSSLLAVPCKSLLRVHPCFAAAVHLFVVTSKCWGLYLAETLH